MTYFIYLAWFLSCCSRWWDFLPFYDWIILLYVLITFFKIRSIIDGHIGCFHLLVIVNTVHNIVSLLWCRYRYQAFILLDIYADVGLWDHVVIICLIFWGATILFSVVMVPFYNPPKMYKLFSFSVSSPTHVTFWFLLPKKSW